MITNRVKQSGFTLIEILVVVVVVSIFATSFIMNTDLNSGPRIVEDEAKRLAALVQAASQHAILSSNKTRMSVYESKYTFEEYVEDEEAEPKEPAEEPDSPKFIWKAIEEHDVLRDKKVAEFIKLERVEGGELVEESGEEDEPPPKFRIFFYPVGEITDFTLKFIDEESESQYQVKADLLARTQVERVVEDE